MKRFLTRAILVAGGLTAGCSETTSDQFLIVQNQVPVGSCLIPASRGAYVGEGTLDVALVGPTATAGYRFHPLLQNDFAPRGGLGAAEPNRILLRSFRVSLRLGTAPADIGRLFSSLAGNAQQRALLEYEEPWSGTIDPGDAVAAGVTAVPGELARKIRETRALEQVSHMTLFAHVQAVGERQVGTIMTPEFIYPIRVCHGCLVGSLRACPITPVALGNPCNLAQDSPVDCCLQGDELRCGSAAAPMTMAGGGGQAAGASGVAQSPTPTPTPPPTQPSPSSPDAGPATGMFP